MLKSTARALPESIPEWVFFFLFSFLFCFLSTIGDLEVGSNSFLDEHINSWQSAPLQEKEQLTKGLQDSSKGTPQSSDFDSQYQGDPVANGH